MTRRERDCKAEFARLLMSMTNKHYGGIKSPFAEAVGVSKVTFGSYTSALDPSYPSLPTFERILDLLPGADQFVMIKAFFARFPKVAEFLNLKLDTYSGTPTASEADTCAQRLSRLSEVSPETTRFLLILNRTAFRERKPA